MPTEVPGHRWQRLRAGGVELLLEIPDVGLPRVLHWGADLGEVNDQELEQLALAAVPQVTSYVMDDPGPLAVLPEHALGAAAPGKPPPWFAETDPKGPGLELSGRTLGTVGVQAPFLRPESLLLLHLSASGRR